ncbi:MAG: hypothetical protein EOM20_16990 [Spartobacteria bacterium]|nr:hypothetical protein [Spartobacteria bacterium]
MNCKKAQQWLSMAMDNELPADRREPLEQHLAQCPDCRAMQSQWSTYGQILRAPEAPAVNAGALRADVLRAIRTQRPERERALFPAIPYPRLAYSVAITALICTVIIAGLRFYPYSAGPETTAEPNTQVEWVETDVPGATAMVYEDEETGLTVIWVITTENGEEENGQAAS